MLERLRLIQFYSRYSCQASQLKPQNFVHIATPHTSLEQGSS